MGDGRFLHPLLPEVRALKCVPSFEKMLHKYMVTVAEHSLFTKSDQDLLVTSLCSGKNEAVSQRRQRVAV